MDETCNSYVRTGEKVIRFILMLLSGSIISNSGPNNCSTCFSEWKYFTVLVKHYTLAIFEDFYFFFSVKIIRYIQHNKTQQVRVLGIHSFTILPFILWDVARCYLLGKLFPSCLKGKSFYQAKPFVSGFQFWEKILIIDNLTRKGMVLANRSLCSFLVVWSGDD